MNDSMGEAITPKPAPAYQPDCVQPLSGHWVDGRSVHDGQGPIPVHRPSDGKKQADVLEAGVAVVDLAIASAQQGQRAWGEMLPRERGRLMLCWADLIERNRERMAQLESVVSSRTYAEALKADVPAVAEWIRFYGEYADKLEGSVTASGNTRLSFVVREPYGVVAIITPWNFPLFLATWKLAPALAAGNAVVVKPSELTPWSVQLLAQLATEAGIPDGVINVVHGTGPMTGAALVRHPGVSYVTFTGSTAVGARIQADASLGAIKPVSLELGGKSPTLVFSDSTDLDQVADHVTWGITRNAGQLCYAGSRLVVEEEVADRLIELVADRMARLEMGSTWAPATTLAPIISAAQSERIQRLVDQTREEGAGLVCGGTALRLGGGSFFEPTILDGVQDHMTGYRTEIFGPVLCVQRFRTVEQGIALANHPTYGLSASVFTRDITKAVCAARSIKAGTVWINRWGRTPEMMTSPFGGYGQSGFGKESGRPGIEGFLRSKAIWIDASETAELAQGGGSR